MANLRVAVWSSRNVTWVALTQNGSLVTLILGPRTNETLKEAALLAKHTQARLFCQDHERHPQAVLNAIESN